MKKSIKRTVATGVVTAGLVLGGAGIVAATTAAYLPGATPDPTTVGDVSDSAGKEISIVGTITAPPEAKDAAEGTENKADETAQDAAEAKALEALATITADQAKAAALAAVPGTTGLVQLEAEDGFVVYQVEVTAQDGTVTEVIIDAGNGSVLAQEVGGANEANDVNETDDGTETPDASEVPAN